MLQNDVRQPRTNQVALGRIVFSVSKFAKNFQTHLANFGIEYRRGGNGHRPIA